MSKATDSAESLTSDLNSVFKKHKVRSRVNWHEFEPEKVTITITINRADGKSIFSKLLGRWRKFISCIS